MSTRQTFRQGWESGFYSGGEHYLTKYQDVYELRNKEPFTTLQKKFHDGI